MGIALGFMSILHLFLFGFLREGILPAAVVSFFSAYGSAYSWRWVIPWAAALAAGVFLHGRLVVAVSVLLFFALQLAVPILLARGAWDRVKSVFFFLLGLYLSQILMTFISPLWRAVVRHPFEFVVFGQAIPTPVDWPWYFLGYYIWERVHSMYRGLPRSWRYFIYK
mgnify:CR=1 FL=1